MMNQPWAQIAIALAFLLYCIIAVDNLKNKDYPHALIWAAYALSQIGFFWYEVSRK